MFKLIDQITENSTIHVCGEKHFVKSKTFYVTEGEQANWYAKMVFEDHSILVIAPFDEFMYFGRIENIFGDGESFPEEITYKGIKFAKVAEDYQIVKQLVFGSPTVAEGEVVYADYSSDEADEVVLSLAVVSRTKNRADVIARVVELNDIELR